MPNPYQPPNPDLTKDSDPIPFLSHRKVFWLGVGSVFAAIGAVVGSELLLVYSLNFGKRWVTLTMIINVLAMIVLVFGLVAIVVCHWFPDPRRKYSWRKRANQDSRLA